MEQTTCMVTQRAKLEVNRHITDPTPSNSIRQENQREVNPFKYSKNIMFDEVAYAQAVCWRTLSPATKIGCTASSARSPQV